MRFKWICRTSHQLFVQPTHRSFIIHLEPRLALPLAANNSTVGSKVAGAVQGAGQAIGKLPQAAAARIGVKGVPALTAGRAGELAGITAAAFPSQYAQEVHQLKAIGMEDNLTMRLLAGGTAAIAGLVEGVVPNPFRTGPVSLTAGAVKAARQYLWNAAKQAPGEMSEEYLQGVTSGLGKHVAQYLDENAEEKSISDAFKTGWEQAKEAALPMAFLLGVPAIGGAGLSASRAQRLRQTLSKGFVSEDDAKQLGIQGKNRKEREANAKAELRWWDFGTGEPAEPPPLPTGTVPPALPSATTQAVPSALPPGTPPPALPQGAQPRVPQQLPPGAPPLPGTKLPLPPLPRGVPDASQVPTNETRDDVQGDGREGSQVDSGSQVYQQGQGQVGAKQASEEPATPQVQVEPPKPQADEPPLAEGMTRLYHGSATPGRTEGKAWFSTHRPYAENYRGKETSELQYVDVPTERVNKAIDPDNYGQTVDKGFAWNVELDSSETGPRKTIGGKVVPATEVAKPPVTSAPQQTEATTAPDEVGSENDIVLYRAGDSDILTGATSFSPDLETAEAYLSNPGFGGKTIYKTKVTIAPEKLVDVSSAEDQAHAIRKAAGIKGMKSSSVEQLLANEDVIEKLQDAGFEWVKLKDSFPEGADTYTWLYSGDEPELELHNQDAPSTGTSGEVGTKPTTGPTENQPSEALADVPAQPESKWSSETRAKLEAVPGSILASPPAINVAASFLASTIDL